MIDAIRTASTLQFILACVALFTFVMIVVQATVRRWVWMPYIVAFVGSLIAIGVTLR